MSIWTAPCPVCGGMMRWIGHRQDEQGYIDFFKCLGPETHIETTRTTRGTMPVIPTTAYPVRILKEKTHGSVV